MPTLKNLDISLSRGLLEVLASSRVTKKVIRAKTPTSPKVVPKLVHEVAAATEVAAAMVTTDMLVIILA
jgi:hypothetical protein